MLLVVVFKIHIVTASTFELFGSDLTDIIFHACRRGYSPVRCEGLSFDFMADIYYLCGILCCRVPLHWTWAVSIIQTTSSHMYTVLLSCRKLLIDFSLFLQIMHGVILYMILCFVLFCFVRFKWLVCLFVCFQAIKG